jgi:23S rRNA (cytidine1920-2'-O)/16S rRNA (cytidine1409-2'-O)-methyltransferase
LAKGPTERTNLGADGSAGYHRKRMTRSRLDIALVSAGLVPTRSRAQAAIIAGRVRVDGHVIDKPGVSVDDTRALHVDAAPEFVSRGGMKLANALDAVGVSVEGVRALDLGASTGGFTDCLLARGAAEVIAVDVGYGQLDWKLRNDPRVHVMERTNARHLTAEALPYIPDFIVSDLAFISTSLVWTSVSPCLGERWRAVLMVKPQFEAGRAHVGSSGVVRDPEVRRAAVASVARTVTELGGTVCGAADSGVPGPKGNREIFLYASRGFDEIPTTNIDAQIDAAVAAGHTAGT